MGLVQDAHGAVGRYEVSARETGSAAHDLAASIAALADRLSGHGPLGSSADPDLERARTRLSIARQRLLAAAEATRASASQARQYVDRAFGA